jgi:exodeoxyribonuclease VII large subunit
MDKKVFTVLQVNQYIKFLFEKDYALRSLFVKGEISNFKNHSSGHLYFTLKDSQSSINCVMFKTAASYLNFEVKNGLSVIICGRVSLYEKTGQYQIYADTMEPAGKGALYLAFEQLKEKLYKEGLFDQAHKKPIPKYPNTIGIITSGTGAAVRDIIQISKRRNPSVELIILPVLVQGSTAAADIARAIALMNEYNNVDVIIVGRGGGSIEDLWAFNEEITARAVYASKIPIISAVGHEVDYTITDFVADLRASTPSAAAELAVPDIHKLKTSIVTNRQRLNSVISNTVNMYQYRLKNLNKRIAFRAPLQQVYELQIYLEKLQKNMDRAILRKLEYSKIKLSNSTEQLKFLSPQTLLDKGYAIAYNEYGQAVGTINDVEKDEVLNIQLKDGYIIANVKAKETGLWQGKSNSRSKKD